MSRASRRRAVTPADAASAYVGDPRVAGLALWAAGRAAPPHTLDISPTDLCNLRCRSCWMRAPLYREQFPSGYQLSDERLLSLVDEASGLGVRHVEITGGGEPLMRKPLVLEMMARIKDSGMEGSMTTNATLLDKESVAEMVRLGWDRLVFSIDAPEARTNDWLRPLRDDKESATGRILSSLELFAKEKHAAGSALPHISFNVVLSQRNAGALSDMMRFAAGHGAETVSVEPLTVHSDLGKELRLAEDEATDLVPEVRSAAVLAQRLGISTNVGRFAEGALITEKNSMGRVYSRDVSAAGGMAARAGDSPLLAVPCYEPWWHLVVKTDGSVGPCCVFEEKAMNVKRMSLSEIWTGPFMTKVRNSLMGRTFLQWCRICNAGQVLQNRRLRTEIETALSGDGS